MDRFNRSRDRSRKRGNDRRPTRFSETIASRFVNVSAVSPVRPLGSRVSSPVDLAACLRAGLFDQALKFLDSRRNLSLVDRVDRLEILHYSGETRQAAREARALLSERGFSAVEASRCTIVLADEAWYSGDFAQAVAFYRKALSSAEQTDNVKQICVAGTLVLERTSDATGFDSSVSLASRVRKLAVRSGDAHLSVSTHLTFGRLEGKAGHFDVARRHFGIARKVLLREPNAWLMAATDLDESGVLSLCGDVVGAIELAKSGGASADDSGWSRGRVAAAATLAFCYVSMGNFADAEAQFSRIERERFNSPSYRLALADTKARAALAAGDWTRAEEILDSCSSELNAVQRWYDLTARHTRVRVLLARRRFEDARVLSDQGISAAAGARVEPLVAAFRLLKAEAEIGAKGALVGLRLATEPKPL